MRRGLITTALAGAVGSAMLFAALAFAALAGSALADTTIGQTGGGNGCGGSYVYADISSPYTVPSGGGSISSFSFQSDSTNTDQQLDFLVLRRVANTTRDYTVVGKTGIVTLQGTGLETFTPAANIPVQAGDILGFYAKSGLANCWHTGSGGLYENPYATDPAQGATVTFNSSHPGADLNESANLVPPAALSYGISFVSPTTTQWTAGKTVPVAIQLKASDNTLMSDADAAALASAGKVTVEASGAQTLAAQPMKYNNRTDQFTYRLRLARTTSGTVAIKVTGTGYTGAGSSTMDIAVTPRRG